MCAARKVDFMTDTLRQNYIELLKSSVSFTLWWPEPAIPMEIAASAFPAPIRKTIIAIARCMKPLRISLAYNRGDITQKHREEGRPYFSAYADTMIGRRRLDNIQSCVEEVIKEKVPGDFIETGVWRGGACIFMRGLLEAYCDRNRKVYVADSFQGLPKPDEEKYFYDKGSVFHKNLLMAVSLKQVKENFEKYNLLDDQVVFLPGWFKDTLPTAPIDKLSILRLDGDMYGSTMEAIEALYPKLSVGGFCIVDDYGAIEGCRRAIDDYRARKNIEDKIQIVDWTGVYWRRSA